VLVKIAQNKTHRSEKIGQCKRQPRFAFRNSFLPLIGRRRKSIEKLLLKNKTKENKQTNKQKLKERKRNIKNAASFFGRKDMHCVKTNAVFC